MSIDLDAQTRGIAFNEIRIKDGNQDSIIEAYEKAMEDVKLTGGVVLLQWIWKGAEDGMTNRMVWDWELGTDWFHGLDPNKGKHFGQKWIILLKSGVQRILEEFWVGKIEMISKLIMYGI